jgi:tetratricopeptide (TPR) repeat protein
MRHGVLILASTLAAISLPGQTPEELKQEGIKAFEAGQFAAAQQTFKLLVQRDPSGENYSYEAVAELRAGEVQAAIAHFQRAIELGYAPGSVHYNLGLALLRLQKTRAGISELKLAAAQEPGKAEVEYSLGVALLEAGEPGSALPYLRKSLARSPRDPAIQANIVRANFESGDTGAALQAIDKAVAAFPQNAALEVSLARICLAHRQGQMAVTLLESAGKLLPNEPEIRLLLARAYVLAEKPREAADALKSVPPEAGAPGEWPHLMAQALAQLGNLKEARAQVSSAIEADPHNTTYLSTSAWIDQLDLQYQQSIETLKHARELEPRRASIPYHMAIGYYYTQRYAQAAEQCQEAVGLAPNYDPAYFLMGISKIEIHDLDGAQAALKRAVELKSASPLYHYELGEALLKAARINESKREFSRTLELDPKFAGAYYWRARALKQEGDLSGALRDMEAAVAIDPGLTLAYHELWQLYKSTGQPEKAAASLAKGEELRVKIRGEQEEILRMTLLSPE